MDLEALDLSKENIQPLKQGRIPAQLGAALQAQTNSQIQHELNNQREEYELAIRTYEGDDPLAPRWEYVCWLEQAFPRHASVLPLLENTIATFKRDPKYINDPRFVQILVKYIESQKNSTELFQTVFSEGIGTMCSYLYKAWAEELDRTGDLKRADQVYQLGIANRAKPTEDLVQAHMLFQLSVGRRMLRGETEDEEGEEVGAAAPKPRSALGRLTTKKVGSLRPSQPRPGVLPLACTPLSSHNSAVPVFKDNEEFLLAGIRGCKVNFTPSEKTHKENAQKPGTWNKAYKKCSVTPHSATTPNFKVHVDESEEKEMPHQVSHTPHALRTRKEEFHCPMALFEPDDPSMMPMYCKQKIYAGGGELQLEEIRAAVYNRRFLHKMTDEGTSDIITEREISSDHSVTSPSGRKAKHAFEIFLDMSGGKKPGNGQKFDVYFEDSDQSGEEESRTRSKLGDEARSGGLKSDKTDTSWGNSTVEENFLRNTGHPEQEKEYQGPRPSDLKVNKSEPPEKQTTQTPQIQKPVQNSKPNVLKFAVFVDGEENTGAKMKLDPGIKEKKGSAGSGRDRPSTVNHIPLHRRKSMFPEDLPKPHFPDSLL